MSTQFRDEISPLETALKEVVAQKLSDHCKVLVDKGVEQIVLDLRKKAAELVAQCSLEIFRMVEMNKMGSTLEIRVIMPNIQSEKL